MGQQLGKSPWVLTYWYWDQRKDQWRPARQAFQTEEDVEEFLTLAEIEIKRYELKLEV